MKLVIDPDLCTGHGRCYYYAPGLVEADDAGYGQVIEPDVDLPPERMADAELAVRSCPELAASLR